MWTLTFWRAVAERALKTAAQAAILAIGADSLAANALTFDWVQVGGFACGGLILSVLTSVASAATTNGTPSLTNAESLNWPVYAPASPSTTVSGGVTTYDPGDGTPPTATLS